MITTRKISLIHVDGHRKDTYLGSAFTTRYAIMPDVIPDAMQQVSHCSQTIDLVALSTAGLICNIHGKKASWIKLRRLDCLCILIQNNDTESRSSFNGYHNCKTTVSLLTFVSCNNLITSSAFEQCIPLLPSLARNA